MRFLVYIGHPAHVHFFKNIITLLKQRGHHVNVLAVDKEITHELLDYYGIEYEKLDKERHGFVWKSIGLILKDIKFLISGLKHKTDVFIGIANIYGSHAAFLLRKKSIWLSDTECSKYVEKLTLPFCTKVLTPTWFTKDYGGKHLRYDGFHELAYLHPNKFKPDKEVLRELNIKEGEKYFIVRFVSSKSTQYEDQQGLTDLDKKEIVSELSRHGRVMISSEGELPEDLREYKISVHPAKIHSLLYYATLYFGESPTMTTESALLGTPAVCVNPWACECGNFKELFKYDLIRCFHPNYSNTAITETKMLLEKKDLKQKWKEKGKNLIKEKEDVTEWATKFIEKSKDIS